MRNQGYYPAGVTDAEINAAAGLRGCPDGYCPLCYISDDFPGALSLSWRDRRGELIDPDNGLCQECYANWLELLRHRLKWRAGQVQQLEARLDQLQAGLGQRPAPLR